MANEYKANALHAEVWLSDTAEARLHSNTAEVWLSDTAEARLYSNTAEVWRSITETSSGSGRRRQAMLGSF